MRSPDSRVVTLLLVAGLSSGATLALCILYVNAAGMPGPASGLPPRALTRTASRPLPQNLQFQTLFQAEKHGSQEKEEEEEWIWHAGSDNIEGRKGCFKREGNDKLVSDMLRGFECGSSAAVFVLVGNLTALVVACVVDLIWHIIHLKYPYRMNPLVRNLSLAVIVFNIFYNKRLHAIISWPFSTSCVVLCIEEVLLRVMMSLVRRRLQNNQEVSGGENAAREKMNKKLARAYTYNINDEDLKELRILNRYQLLSAHFSTTFFLFLCQLTLGAFYIFKLNNFDDGWGGVSGWRWFIGVLLCNIAGEEEVGSSFQFSFWTTVLSKKSLMDVKTRIFACVPVTYRAEVRMRMVMSIIVNLFFRRIIFCTTPVLLGVVVDPLDFIKDCLAVFFITKLDDLDDAIAFTDDLEKIEDEHMSDGVYSLVFQEDGGGQVDETELQATREDLEGAKTELINRIIALEQRVDQWIK